MTPVIFIRFVLASLWKLHAIFTCSIYGVEETTSDKKTCTILFGIKEKQLLCEKYLYRVYYYY